MPRMRMSMRVLQSIRYAQWASFQWKDTELMGQGLLCAVVKNSARIPFKLSRLCRAVDEITADLPDSPDLPEAAPITSEIRTICNTATSLTHAAGRDTVILDDLWQAIFMQTKGSAADAIVSAGLASEDLLETFRDFLRDGYSTDDEELLQEDELSDFSLDKEPPSAAFHQSGEESHNLFEEFEDEETPQQNQSILEKYTQNLTEKAAEAMLDPMIGREKEINRILQILLRRTKNNPMLIGEPGVGKSAVVEGLAQQIYAGNVPEALENKQILSLDLTGLVAGTKYRGEFEDRFKQVMNEIVQRKNVILFIDEIHTIMGAGSAEGALDMANILKPVLARGELQCIGATTISEYRKRIEKDSALERRFQTVQLDEPDSEETLRILQGIRGKYEKHHGLKIGDDTLKAAVSLSIRYIPDRFLPDKAIDLMDEAASRVRIAAYSSRPDVHNLEQEAAKIKAEKAEAVKNQNYEKAAQLRDKQKRIEADIFRLNSQWKESVSLSGSVTPEDVADVVSSWTGIPVKKLTESEASRLMNLEETLHKRLIGQNEPVTAVAKAVKRARSGMKDPKRPIGSFLFLGPTGVGKTELCRALAEALFGDENAMIRLDMSEFMEKHTVSKLVGSPPGYVGYDEGGQLTDAVRKKPYSVLLLDEVEKAHPDVFNMLLQILDEGRLTDSQGRTAYFKNTIIVMTSNAGAHKIAEGKHVGFGSGSLADASSDKEMQASVMKEVKNFFRPEFLNRLDEIIVFHSLGNEEILQITGLMMNEVAGRLQENGMKLSWDDAVIEKLSNDGFDPKYGARPIKREIQRQVEDMLSDELLQGTIACGDTVHLKVVGGKITAEKK